MYKIKTVRTSRFGDCQPVFISDDGKAYSLPFVGRVWKQRADGQWAAHATVVNSQRYGLLRYESFKSRTTKPLVLAANEVYLPIEKTGSKMLLATLPE